MSVNLAPLACGSSYPARREPGAAEHVREPSCGASFSHFCFSSARSSPSQPRDSSGAKRASRASVVSDSITMPVSPMIPTSAPRFGDAVLDGLKAIVFDSGIDPARLGSIIHGTTVATNAILEGRGAVTALAWSPDGKRIAIGDEAGRGALINVA